MPSATVEDYIKHIYIIAESEKVAEVPMGRVADALGVVPGTATTMVKALADAGLVNYAPRVGVQLSEPGRKLALHVLRRHRLLEQFLVEVLGLDWSEVHDEAEQLEHVISDRLLERIDSYLGHPTEDPHGDPIPTAEGELQSRELSSLASCTTQETVQVARISDQDTEFLQYVAQAGLNPGVQVRVVQRNLTAESVQLRLEGTNVEMTLGMGAASKIYVLEPDLV
ncbi:metal-dependent transcriptional regulator [Coraliomargarita akajimensis]|uniref:Transcriptional regulator MntR n=1 Tax=Coraliomargarita akajimensis (strain DSM 45221 / IAM 15411 / JCM 23193 / KCTC 12865 / 04OKA010-24) TaxID=583355 RepID=D5ELU0_CORAD|nr:metal-dependent transcriptional regulator [Coraliomargarita akajimensis]ADE53265.1 iron (metal) dependent repressor, DtxR family [Coraliomargarita akajimensis DSM 45221]